MRTKKTEIGEVFVDGTSNILTKSDFADLERLRDLLSTIGEKSRLIQILNECVARDDSAQGDVQVVIGSENRTPSLSKLHAYFGPVPYRQQFGGRNAQRARPDTDRIRTDDIDRLIRCTRPRKNDVERRLEQLVSIPTELQALSIIFNSQRKPIVPPES